MQCEKEENKHSSIKRSRVSQIALKGGENGSFSCESFGHSMLLSF